MNICRVVNIILALLVLAGFAEIQREEVELTKEYATFLAEKKNECKPPDLDMQCPAWFFHSNILAARTRICGK